mgnify:CR=1 FL=1
MNTDMTEADWGSPLTVSLSFADRYAVCGFHHEPEAPPPPKPPPPNEELLEDDPEDQDDSELPFPNEMKVGLTLVGQCQSSPS